MTRDIIKKILFFMEQKKPFLLATILTNSGSTPRSKGTRMIIGQNGDTYGTIGGGVLEAKIIQYASKTIEKNQPWIKTMNLSSKKAGGMGMLCGGHTSILLDPILPKKDLKELFTQCLNAIDQGKKCTFLTIYHTDKPRIKKIYHSLFCNDINLTELPPLDMNELNIIKKAKQKHQNFKIIKINNKTIICSSFIESKKVYILGAGHIAQPTASIASIVGFEVIVMDDRQSFANTDNFPTADTIKIVDFKDISKIIQNAAFIVIITRGHTYDMVVLEQALSTKATYIGMIGSAKKRDSIFDNLREKGISEKTINRVHSPIGIDIGSETPEEIALSIVAEMVYVRTKNLKN